jgi:hypothetical protein
MSPAGVIEIRDQGDWVATTDAPRVDAHRHRAAISDHLRRITDDAPAFCDVAAVVVLTRHSTAQARDLLCLGTRREFEQWIEVWGFDDLQYDPAYVLTGSRHPVPRPVSPACIDALHHLVFGPAAAVVRPLPRLAARAARLALEVESVVVIVDHAASPGRLRDATLARCSEIGASANRITFAGRHELCQRAVDGARLWGHVLGSPEDRSLASDDDVRLGIEAYRLGHGLRFDAVLVAASPDENGAGFDALYPHVLRPGGELLVMRDDSDDARRRIVEPSYEMSF